MANSPYTDLIDNVLPFLAADPSDPVTEVAIRRAAIEFIAGSWVWQILADPIAVTAGVASYALSAPAGASVSAVLDAQLDGDPLTAKALAWLNANLPNWRMQPGTPSYYTQTDSENIVLAPLPAWASSYGLTVTLALQPADASSEIPEWIASQYGRYIADGAVAILIDRKSVV